MYKLFSKIAVTDMPLNNESTVDENVALPPPTFSAEHKQLVVETWHYVENHVTEVIKRVS